LGVEQEQELAIARRLRFHVCGIDNALRQSQAQFEMLGDEFLPVLTENPAEHAIDQR
jgi:hypothetical protein